MPSLRVLSLGRNMIKKIEGVEPVAETLEELWLSYNGIERLVRSGKGRKSAAAAAAAVGISLWRRVPDGAGLPNAPLPSSRKPPSESPLDPTHHQQQQNAKAGVEKLANLRVLYLSNNRLRDWSEVDRLGALTRLEDLLLVGNPLFNEARDAGTTADYRVQVIKRVPGLKKLDGVPVDVDERDQAAAA